MNLLVTRAKFRDTWNFLSSLSARKVWNMLLAEISFRLSNLFQKPMIWGDPWFISIETSSVCNLSCPQCPVGKGDIDRLNKFLPLERYNSLLDQIAQSTSMLSLYFQGEPLMQKNFFEYVRLASNAGIYTQTSTNAQLLDEEVCRQLVDAGLKRIIISMDGTNQESYEQYRVGGRFQSVENGVRSLSRMRREMGKRYPYIIIQFLVFSHNEKDIIKAKEYARDWGADETWIKSAQIEYNEVAEDYLPDSDKYNRYIKGPDGELKLRGKLRNRCNRLWKTAVITSDAIVVPCCFDKRASYKMGDLSEAQMVKIWRNKNYREFRKKVLRNRKGIKICSNCTEGIAKVYS